MSAARDRTVLVVSEDAAYLSVLKLCMRTCGFSRVQAATNAVAALKYLDGVEFDLILSDWDMALLDGLELLRIARRLPKSAATPFVLMAANRDETCWEEAVDLGVTDFILKPLTIAALYKACFHACRPVEFEGENVVPLRARTRRGRLEPQIEPSLAPEARPAVVPVRGRWRNYCEQLLRLFNPVPG